MAEGTTTPEMLDRTSEHGQIKGFMEQTLSNGEAWYNFNKLKRQNTLAKSVLQVFYRC